MKKTIIFIMTFILLCTSITSVSASSSEILTKNEAMEIAMIYLKNNFNDQDVEKSVYKFDSTITLYNTQEGVNGYTFLFTNEDENFGYITISADMYTYPIIEYSLDSFPTYYNVLDEYVKNKKNVKVVMENVFTYYVKYKSDYVNIYTGEIVDKKDLFTKGLPKSEEKYRDNKKLKNLITEANDKLGNFGSEYAGQYSGYVISDRFSYMNDRYGGYNYQSGDELSSFTGFLQSNYGGANDCTLVAISTIANWYRNQGKSSIPKSISSIYNDVLVNGKNHGYTTTGGTNPTVIDDIIEDTYYDWGYNVNASNIYAWSYSTFTSEISKDRPVIFNITTGAYSNHSVSIYGYKTYDVAKFLMVKDNWTTSTRYIHWEQMWNEVGSVTKMYFN